MRAAAIAATLAAWDARRRAPGPVPQVEPGWRNVPTLDQVAVYAIGELRVEVAYRHLGGGRFEVAVAGVRRPAQLISAADGVIAFEDDGVRATRRVIRDGERAWVDGLVLALEPRFPDATREAMAGGLIAPMPARVAAVLVAEGATVAAGATLLVLEAMKMEHAVKAPEAGTVTRLAVAAGDQVAVDQLLAVVTP